MAPTEYAVSFWWTAGARASKAEPEHIVARVATTEGPQRAAELAAESRYPPEALPQLWSRAAAVTWGKAGYAEYELTARAATRCVAREAG